MADLLSKPALPAICWILLLVLQPLWHIVLPEPIGNRSWLLTVVATLPLLLPLRGIVAGSTRSWTWGGYLALLYFTVAVTETWSNPAQRAPAAAQAALVVAYVAAVLLQVKRSERPGGRGQRPGSE